MHLFFVRCFGTAFRYVKYPPKFPFWEQFVEAG